MSTTTSTILLAEEHDATRAFLADKRDSRVKRDLLVDHLIGSPDYVEYWTNKWADLLQVNRKFLGVEGAAVVGGGGVGCVVHGVSLDRLYAIK